MGFFRKCGTEVEISVHNLCGFEDFTSLRNVQGGSNMTGTDLYVNKPHCATAVRP